jgi:hypothetical protein
MQDAIDDGIRWCEHCDVFGRHDFCGGCGRRYFGGDLIWRECPNRDCKAKVTTDWCPVCGELVVDDFFRRLERGEVDVEEEGQVAGGVLRQMIARRPDIASDLYGHPAPIGRGVMSLAEALQRALPRAAVDDA